MNDVFVVSVSRSPIMSNISYTSKILSVSYSEETAWASIERDINERFIKNEFGYPCIAIYPEIKLVYVTVPICCGCGVDTIDTQYNYKIIRKLIVN